VVAPGFRVEAPMAMREGAMMALCQEALGGQRDSAQVAEVFRMPGVEVVGRLSIERGASRASQVSSVTEVPAE
jgi:hypothetical protein